MRFPVRWRIRTLLVAILVAGLVAGGVALKRRAERLARIGQEYASWEGRFNKMIPILDDHIEMDRKMVEDYRMDVESAEKTLWIFRDAEELARAKERLEDERSELERQIAVRSKFTDLQAYARQEARRYADAARQPWWTVSDGEAIGPKLEALRKEFFEGGGE